MKNKSVLVIFLFFFIITKSVAQQMDDSISVHFKNGNTSSCVLSKITVITFSDSTVHSSVEKSNQKMFSAIFFPNPLQTKTSCDITLPKSGTISMTIYNARGAFIQSFEFPNCIAGKNHVEWDGSDIEGNSVPQGSYTIIIRYRNELLAKKIIRAQ